MLGLEVAAPVDGVLELVVVLFEDFDGLGVGHAAEVGGHHVVEPIQEALVYDWLKKAISSGACSST